jgi:hypothetical protein
MELSPLMGLLYEPQMRDERGAFGDVVEWELVGEAEIL